MEKYKIGIDKKFLPRKCREWADRLEKDYWANLYNVIGEMSFQLDVYTEKIKGMAKYMAAKRLEEYGRLRDAGEKLKTRQHLKAEND